ncbi:hypothetical protein TrVGV298_008904 [Trichoderma virens]|nr:hypothetical protein TrVGV298_008904 [Trichoderma virens]
MLRLENLQSSLGLVTAPLALTFACFRTPRHSAPGLDGRSYSALPPLHRRWIPTGSGRFCGLVSISLLVKL